MGLIFIMQVFFYLPHAMNNLHKYSIVGNQVIHMIRWFAACIAKHLNFGKYLLLSPRMCGGMSSVTWLKTVWSKQKMYCLEFLQTGKLILKPSFGKDPWSCNSQNSFKFRVRVPCTRDARVIETRNIVKWCSVLANNS